MKPSPDDQQALEDSGRWIIAVGFTVYIIAEMVKIFLPPLDPFDSKLAPRVVKQIGDTALLLAILVMIVTGVRTLRRYGFHWKRLVMPVSGVLSCGCFIATCLYGYYVFAYTHDTILRRIPFEEADLLDRPLSVRSKVSKWYAEDQFQHTGETITYINEGGKSVLFEPTEKDLGRRQEHIEGLKLTESGKTMMLRGTIRWSIVLIIGVTFGMITSVRSIKATTT